MSYELNYDNCRDLIESTIKLICRIKHLPAADADDFAQEARMKFIEKGVLRQYDGRGSIEGFVRTVVLRVYQDYLIKLWGKWRPSVEAQQHGPIAEWLEQYVLRDGYTFGEAYETLRTNHGVELSLEALDALVARLPLRVLRKPENDGALVSMPDASALPDAVLLRKERQAYAASVREALRSELLKLDPKDRLIIKLRYVDGLQFAKIARLLQEPERPLYRHCERLRLRLRRALEARGIDAKGLFGGDTP